MRRGADERSRGDVGSDSAPRLRAGTPQYRAANRVLFVAGFIAFSMLYVTQGMLPEFTTDFGVSPAAASLTVSLTSLPLAMGVVVAASVSERRGRRQILVLSVLTASVCSLVTAVSPSFTLLIVLRVLTGLSLAGLPAVAMAYIAEEVETRSLGSAIGLYISGTGLGGLAGRLVGGVLAGLFGWRTGVAVVGATALVGSLYVARRLPPSLHFRPQPEALAGSLRAAGTHLRDGLLRRLFLCGFVLIGAQVAFFNYLLYRLRQPPFELSQGTAALFFLLYLPGTLSASWMGRLADRRGRRFLLRMLLLTMLAGLLLTLPDSLVAILFGAALVTIGFFGAHSVASSWVNAQAKTRRAQASSLYLFFYQLGSAVLGFVGGLAYAGGGWTGVVLMSSAGLALGLLATWGLARGASGSRAAPGSRSAPGHLLEP